MLDVLGRNLLADDVERLDRLDVPAGRRSEHVAAPLVVSDRKGFVFSGRPAEMDLKTGRTSTTRLAVGVEDSPRRLG